jgi:predicted ATPase
MLQVGLIQWMKLCGKFIMIKNVHIRGFKCFDDEVIDFSNLTVITGPNSSGKSSLIQAILLNLNFTNRSDREIGEYLTSLGDFIDRKNKYVNPHSFIIKLCLNEGRACYYEESVSGFKFNKALESDIPSDNVYEWLQNANDVNTNIYSLYLSANRKAIEEKNDLGNNFIDGSPYCGINAQYIANYYYFHKEREVFIELRHPSAAANTLEAQVNYWLSYVCDTELSLNVDKVTSTLYRAYYKIENQEYKPQNLGAGVSYLIAILAKGLLMRTDVQEVFIIENPEIHLHPKSQARLAEFFAFVARTGRQIIIETHSEHLISKLRYCIYNKQIEASQVVIQYRQPDKFEKIEILPNGKLLNETGEHSFPRGFFDATLDNIFEINSNV